MKKIIMIFLTIMFIAVGCAKNDTAVKRTSQVNYDKIKNLEKKIKTLELDNEKIKGLQVKIKSLEIENNKMKIELDNRKKEKKNFNKLNHLAVKFVNAQTQGNIEELKKVLAEEVELEEKEGDIYESGFLLYSKDKLGIYEYMVIQAYEYIPEDDMYKINIKESYKNAPGQSVNLTGLRYVDLYFKEINGEWKITSLIIDI